MGSSSRNGVRIIVVELIVEDLQIILYNTLKYLYNILSSWIYLRFVKSFVKTYLVLEMLLDYSIYDTHTGEVSILF